MAQRQWEKYLEQHWGALHGTYDNWGFEFTDESDSDGSPWIQLDASDGPNPPPYAGAAPPTHISINDMDITEFVQAISLNTGDAVEAMNQVAEQIRAAGERAGEVVRVSLRRIGNDPYYIDDDLSSRDLTDEDFQRWQDAIDGEPTSEYFEPSDPPSDDLPDLLDRIAAGVREWDDEKGDEDRGET